MKNGTEVGFPPTPRKGRCLMRLASSVGAVLAALVAVEPALAQFLYPPSGGPGSGPGIIVGSGFGTRHHGRRLTISGVWGDRGVLSYGPVTRVTVQYVTPIYAPAPLLRLLGAGRPVDDDLSGVDLDLIPAKKPL